MHRSVTNALALVVALALGAGVRPAAAGELDHYLPGLPNLRDLIVPDPGFYFIGYNAFYESHGIDDTKGHEIDGVTVRHPLTGATTTIPIDTDIDVYAFAPTFAWVSDWHPLGMKVGALVLPTFSSASVNAAIGRQRFGRSAEVDSSFGLGDLYVQPVWLGRALPHWDFSFAYGFYAPVGRYDTKRITIPVLGHSVRVEEADNLGLGFWTHQLQGAIAWYPWESKGTAATAGVTWEINGEKQDFDVTPGQHLTLNYGVSQYLPLSKDASMLLELGPAGYSQWQVTDDRGAGSSDTRDQVHAIGGQLGLTYVPWMMLLNVKIQTELHAEDRARGNVITVTLAKKLF